MGDSVHLQTAPALALSQRAQPVERVAELLLTLGKTRWAYHLYGQHNASYGRFLSALRSSFLALWDHTDSIDLVVEETRIELSGETVYENENRAESLAFLFRKEGVRGLTFLCGFEEEELEPFVSVLHQAQHLRTEEDDLLTLLWEGNFSCLRYWAAEIFADGLAIPEPSDPAASGVTRALRAVAHEEELETLREGDALAEDARHARAVGDGFDARRYYLDGLEHVEVGDELQKELERDVVVDALDALFDCLEAPEPKLQRRIVKILRALLPSLLRWGRLDAVIRLLGELDALRGTAGVFDEEMRREAAAIEEELSDETNVSRLIRALEDNVGRVPVEMVTAALRHVRRDALAPVMAAAETSESRPFRSLVEEAVANLAREDEAPFLRLLVSPDARVAAGAARLMGRIRAASAVPELVRLLGRPEESVRRVAVDALVAVGAREAVRGLLSAVSDRDRAVRIAAARGLGALRIRETLPRLRDLILGKAIRDADLTEKLAFFEAYADVGAEASVPVLEALLNARGLLARKQASDLRACAALALGRIPGEAAEAALHRAVAEPEVVVRSAVARALKRES
ncbi:MAG: HEAT repeat domain-containing protein [Gemmatimonadetes bacterium]|nr:HEAT repeat domain-containing protein [Gemmatimonadota bacterium]